jgi:hypothetical protein
MLTGKMKYQKRRRNGNTRQGTGWRRKEMVRRGGEENHTCRRRR